MKARPRPGAFASLMAGLILSGCTSTFAFYENAKVAISMVIDPQAPDPVEITAAFKETVFALVPLSKETDPLDASKSSYQVGKVLSDFDVRYGRDPTRVLYATINHGLATGTAAKILAARGVDELSARKIVIGDFLAKLDKDADVKAAAETLGLAGPAAQPSRIVLDRLLVAVRAADETTVKEIETKLKGKFSNFTPWTRPKS